MLSDISQSQKDKQYVALLIKLKLEKDADTNFDNRKVCKRDFRTS